MFRVILALSTVFAVLYAGYWTVGWVTLPKAAEAWADQRRSEGWQVDWADLTVTGFPSRFDTTMNDIQIADPETGWAWSAPFFQLLALSYKPHHLIAVWPDQHQLATPTATWDIAQHNAKASLVFSNGADLRIARATLVADNLTIRDAGPGFGTQSLRFAIKPHLDQDLTYDIGLSLADLRPAPQLKSQLDPAGLLPEALSALSLDATLGFDAPWDRFALESRRPQPTSLKINTAQANWGGLDLRIAADLTIDSFGQASGPLTLKATNWREIVTLIHNANLLPASALPLVESALTALAEASGPPNTLDLPLTVRQGRIRLGLIPLGTLPALTLR